MTRLAAASEPVCWRTASIHSAPEAPAVVPPAAAMAARTAVYPGWVKLSGVSASNTGPANAAYCRADFSASRCGHSVGSRGSGRATTVGVAVDDALARVGADDCLPPPLDWSRTLLTTWATSSQPTQPASWRAYSSRSVGSLIRATIGTHRRSAVTRPSAFSRSWSASAVRIANSNNGVRRATRSRSAPSPDFSRRSHGSMPSAATATNDCPARFCSPSNAFTAAARPAASPSNT